MSDKLYLLGEAPPGQRSRFSLGALERPFPHLPPRQPITGATDLIAAYRLVDTYRKYVRPYIAFPGEKEPAAQLDPTYFSYIKDLPG
ncbi:hypothetical protein BDK51DRAFT_43416 [Blyttiomyces helicus]|uniref:Uncharacterized protein n=1 Tax=Blyttiomyces helicus TaxID=388810 RepID=A0A4P9WN53_9FUNG|nr:hypothetical protein BDK51DRAFT_43416 [Blyttiomyces helicus]|eukprot:RKO92186.1 hypothetical protein BDK51DRAFT_43416 [Blyttiomyces helicus]